MLEAECPQDVIGSALGDLVAGVAEASEGLGRRRRAAREEDRGVAGLIALEEAEHAGRIDGPTPLDRVPGGGPPKGSRIPNPNLRPLSRLG